MDITRTDLDQAAASGLLSPQQASSLWTWLEQRRIDDGGVRISPSTGRVVREAMAPVMARFDLVHVAWYAGALLIMGALGWFANLGIEAWGGPGVLGIAVVYGTLFAAMGAHFWRTPDMKVLGGVLVAAAVAMTPAAVYGFERTIGVWPDSDPGSYAGFFDWIKGGWFAMEVATIVVAVIALRLVPYSFVALPLALTAWFMSMDLAGLVFDHPDTEERAAVSIAVGVALGIAGYVLRRRQRQDLGYWIEVAAVLAFNGGLMSVRSEQLGTKFIFLAIQCGLLSLGALWQRRVFTIGGVIGVVGLAEWVTTRGNDSEQLWMSVGVGLCLLAFGLLVRWSQWWTTSLFALLAGAIVMSTGPFGALKYDAEAALALWALWQIVVVGFGVFVRSRLVLAVGALALSAWLVHLADRVFADSMVFPLVLISIGLLIIVGGVGLHRRRHAIDAFIDTRLPQRVRDLRGPA
jgi:hypothetical protein